MVPRWFRPFALGGGLAIMFGSLFLSAGRRPGDVFPTALGDLHGFTPTLHFLLGLSTGIAIAKPKWAWLPALLWVGSIVYFCATEELFGRFNVLPRAWIAALVGGVVLFVGSAVGVLGRAPPSTG